MLSFFPLDVLDEIWEVIESVSEGFLTYSCIPLTVTRPKLSLHVFLYTVKHSDNVSDLKLKEKTSLLAQATELLHLYSG